MEELDRRLGILRGFCEQCSLSVYGKEFGSLGLHEGQEVLLAMRSAYGSWLEEDMELSRRIGAYSSEARLGCSDRNFRRS